MEEKAGSLSLIRRVRTYLKKKRKKKTEGTSCAVQYNASVQCTSVSEKTAAIQIEIKMREREKERKKGSKEREREREISKKKKRPDRETKAYPFLVRRLQHRLDIQVLRHCASRGAL